MEGKGRWIILGAAAIAISIITFFVGRSYGVKEGLIQDQVEAIKAGHAKYVIVDEYGRTEFRWFEKGDAELKKEEAKKDDKKPEEKRP